MQAEQDGIVIRGVKPRTKQLNAANAGQDFHRAAAAQLLRQRLRRAVKAGIPAEQNRNDSRAVLRPLRKLRKRQRLHVRPHGRQTVRQSSGGQHNIRALYRLPRLLRQHGFGAHTGANQNIRVHAFVIAASVCSAAAAVASKSACVCALPTNIASNCAGAR